MLLFPEKILTASGSAVDMDAYAGSLRNCIVISTLRPKQPIACYPPQDEDAAEQLLQTSIDKVIFTRDQLKKRSPDSFRAGIIKILKEVFPEPLSDTVLNLDVDNDTVRRQVEEHFRSLISTFNKGVPPQSLMQHVNMGGDFTTIWEDIIPAWLTKAVDHVPIFVLPQEESEDWGKAIGESQKMAALEYTESASRNDKTLTIFEEAMHIAQGQSQYWRTHENQIQEAAEALKARISVRDADGRFDQEPTAKSARQHLIRHRKTEKTVPPFWRYDQDQWGVELCVDMALIESQLLTGTHNSRPRTQEAVDRIMESRFPEMYDHYKAFINDCVAMAVANLPEGTEAQDRTALQNASAAPFKDFAPQVYKLPPAQGV